MSSYSQEDHWSRFIVKQVHDSLRPRSNYVEHHSAHDVLESKRGRIAQRFVPVHNEQSTRNGWTWYEMGFVVHWKAPNSVSILCFDLPEQLQTSLRSALSQRTEDIDLTNPYTILSVILDELIPLYDDSVWSLRNHVCKVESVGLSRSPLRF